MAPRFRLEVDVQRQIIKAPDAPAAIGPYSQAVLVGDTLYVSGQIALDPATGQLIQGDVRAQTERVLANLRAVLVAAGLSMPDVVRTTIFLANIEDFAAVNEVYGLAFSTNPPARSTIQAAQLPRGALVEIDAIAVKE
ncbi:MAG: putative endoribonuclease [Chloroflexi bacterium]|nr:putative endoribonuclease [Chloroflexota bacterium]